MNPLCERACRIAAAICCLAAASALPASAQVNTGTDASQLSFVACNGRAGFRTSELQQMNMTLNADADTGDTVFHVVDLVGGTVTNVGIDASGGLGCSGDVFAFGASEANEGMDLNGDLDLADVVLHTYNAATSTLTNIGIAVNQIVGSSTLIAFTVPEGSQGVGGTDYNGDLDMGDEVAFVLDPTTLATASTGADAKLIRADGNTVGILTREPNQNNSDLNGDTDAVDDVLQVYDAAGPTLYNSGRASESDFGVSGGVVAFRVSESKQGLSLNPDADKSDTVLHLYCLPTAGCTSSGTINLQLASKGVTISGDLVATTVSERSQNAMDLNGDGDRNDAVAHVYRISTGVTTNVMYDARTTPQIAGDNVVLKVRERKQLVVLNADNDLGDDVAVIYNAATSTITNTQRAVGRLCRNELTNVFVDCMAAKNDMLILLTSETKQHRTDLNGDGDRSDLVAEFWRFSTQTLFSTGIAADKKSGLALGNTIAAFRGSERRQKQDLNGDVDRRDTVMYVLDTTGPTVINLGQAADSLFVVDGNTVVFRTYEGSQSTLLNGDIDFNDNILQYQGF